MNYRDAELLNQSFGQLQDSILRNRMLQEQRAQRGQEMNFRERELAERVKQAEYERDPKNPRNRVETAQATLDEDAVKNLGVQQIDAEWTGANGQSYKVKGPQDKVTQAFKDNPPAPSEKMTVDITFEDGFQTKLTGTFEQIENRQKQLKQAHGAMVPAGPRAFSVPLPSGQTIEGVTTPGGGVHTTATLNRAQPMSTQDRIELESLTRRRDELDKKIDDLPDNDPNLGRLRKSRNAIQEKIDAFGKAKPTTGEEKTITDKQGKKWRYKGSMSDPTQDRNPANWEPIT